LASDPILAQIKAKKKKLAGQSKGKFVESFFQLLLWFG
jgi:hypothetical protein